MSELRRPDDVSHVDVRTVQPAQPLEQVGSVDVGVHRAEFDVHFDRRVGVLECVDKNPAIVVLVLVDRARIPGDRRGPTAIHTRPGAT